MRTPAKRSPGGSGHRWRVVSARVTARATHCWLCLRPLRGDLAWPHEDSTSVHHVVPLSAGGAATDERNLEAVHLGCNLKVGDKIVAQGYLVRREIDALHASRRWL